MFHVRIYKYYKIILLHYLPDLAWSMDSCLELRIGFLNKLGCIL